MRHILLSLSHLGSHNAITYCLDMNDRSPVDPMQPDMLQKLDKYMKPLIRPFVYKWAITQVMRHVLSFTMKGFGSWVHQFTELYLPCLAGVHYKAAAGLRGQILRPENRTQAQRQLHRPLLLPRRLHHSHSGGEAFAHGNSSWKYIKTGNWLDLTIIFVFKLLHPQKMCFFSWFVGNFIWNVNRKMTVVTRPEHQWSCCVIRWMEMKPL